jgi:signal transduction histidine kinase
MKRNPVKIVFGPFPDAATYARLGFLLSALALAGVWLGVLIAVWTVTVALAITPLVVPALMGLALAVRACAAAEAWLAGSLLGRAPRLPAARRARGFWRRGWTVLSDPFVWRAQAYLLARMTAGFAVAVVLLSVLAAGLYLLAAPTFFWAVPGGLGPDGYKVTALPEALALVPAGLIVLVASFHAIGPLASAWRTLCLVLLDSDRASSQSAPRGGAPAARVSTSAPAGGAAAPGARVPAGAGRAGGDALRIHMLVSGGLGLLLVAIWALTSRGYFWPVWPLLSLSLLLAIHSWIEHAIANRDAWRARRLDTAFAIHAGIWGSMLLFLVGVWAAGGDGYPWPLWPLLAGLIVLGAHAAALLMRSPDRELTERISVLERSRAGAVDVQEAELRRIERDLHDGAQARLVALGMSLGMAERKLATEDPEAARRLLAEARTGAGEALRELRDLARGIHPPLLADRGLDAAVRALASASPISVTVSATMPGRPKPPVESAAYFVVAEALANAGKHAQATRVDVRIALEGEELAVEVHDDGVGGADPAGSGLDGLRRRVEALDGTLTVLSPEGGPTTIRARIPGGR